MVLMNQTFFKAKKHHYIKIADQLKWKLAWNVYKDYDVKTVLLQEGWIQLKMKLLLVL